MHRQKRTYDSRCAKDASHQVARQETGGRTRTPKSFVRYSGKMGRRTDRASERADRERGRGKKQYFDDEIRNDFRLRRRKSRNEPVNVHEMERNTEQPARARAPRALYGTPIDRMGTDDETTMSTPPPPRKCPYLALLSVTPIKETTKLKQTPRPSTSRSDNGMKETAAMHGSIIYHAEQESGIRRHRMIPLY